MTPLCLDVTSTAQIEAAASQVGSLDMLINNAGIALPDDLTDPAMLERHLAVNLFGTYAVTQAFLPAVTRARGAIVNILSVNTLAPLPFVIPAYSVSKVAAFSLTQSLRARVAGQGVSVHAVLPGPVDTDMLRDPAYRRPPRNRSRGPSSTRRERGRENLPRSRLGSSGRRLGR